MDIGRVIARRRNLRHLSCDLGGHRMCFLGVALFERILGWRIHNSGNRAGIATIEFQFFGFSGWNIMLTTVDGIQGRIYGIFLGNRK
jgi:hypothetical protein